LSDEAGAGWAVIVCAVMIFSLFVQSLEFVSS
jgi:hypothetical protein